MNWNCPYQIQSRKLRFLFFFRCLHKQPFSPTSFSCCISILEKFKSNQRNTFLLSIKIILLIHNHGFNKVLHDIIVAFSIQKGRLCRAFCCLKDLNSRTKWTKQLPCLKQQRLQKKTTKALHTVRPLLCFKELIFHTSIISCFNC